MNSYVLLIGDGHGAASRGTEGETLYTFHAEANSLDEAIDKCQEEIREIDCFDDFELAVAEDVWLTYSRYFNQYKEAGAGDIWMLAYIENGKVVWLYDVDISTGEDGAYKFAKPSEAKQFGLKPRIKDRR